MKENLPYDDIEQLKSLLDKYQLLVENTAECIWMLDLSTKRFKYINPSIQQLRGFTQSEAMAGSLEDSLTPESLEKMKQISDAIINAICSGDFSPESTTFVTEIKQYCKDGSIKDIEISTRAIQNHTDHTISVLGVSRDISHRKSLERKLNQEIQEKNLLIEKLSAKEQELLQLTKALQSKNDLLSSIIKTDKTTGAHSRYYFDQRVHEEIRKAGDQSIPLSMIFFDLDHFKVINDSYGHDIGDEVLVGVASIAERFIRNTDTLARWGGEEFMILMPKTQLEEAARLAEELRIIISQTSFSIAGKVTASFGAAQWAPPETFDRWFKRIDYALYRSKSDGRNCVSVCGSTEDMPIASVQLAWRSEWECGYQLIDSQHKTLLLLANRLMDMSLTQKSQSDVLPVLEALLSHIVKHFHDEEQIMQEVQYPNYPEHAVIHQSLTERALQVKQLYLKGDLKSSAFFSFMLDEVLMGHLLAEDVKFFPYMKYSKIKPYHYDDWIGAI